MNTENVESLWRWLLICMFIGMSACAQSHESSAPGGPASDAVGPASPSDALPSGTEGGSDLASGDSASHITCHPGEPCQVSPLCEGSWDPSPLPSHPWWVASPPASCLENLNRGSAASPEALDDCPPPPHDFMPNDCGIPYRQARICINQQWTQTCQESGDCPDGMVCVDGPADGTVHTRDNPAVGYAYCQQRCGGAEDIACVRCGQQCSAEGYCQPEPPRTFACVADCQCLDGEICDRGQCIEVGQPPRFICGAGSRDVDPAWACDCMHGSCESDPRTGRGCCRAADGHIAISSDDPACR